NIITVDDPIEYVHEDDKSIITQREIGVDCVTFAAGLKGALRQDPDVILVGEMRDLETIETAILAAETGHLVMSTLHTLDATETITRVISAFPENALARAPDHVRVGAGAVHEPRRLRAQGARNLLDQRQPLGQLRREGGSERGGADQGRALLAPAGLPPRSTWRRVCSRAPRAPRRI